jgi:Ca2+-binding RTX toxin-like protein
MNRTNALDQDAPTLSDLDPQVTFLSKVTSDGHVASESYGTWDGTIPATYKSDLSDAAKWGDPNLSPTGSAGGNVTYWFDTNSQWSTDVEQPAFESALALWSALANITFSEATDAANANVTFVRGTDGAYQQFGDGTQASTVGATVMSTPAAGSLISIDTRQPTFGPITTSFTKNGGDPYNTMVHEIGHMLGLGHSGPYNSNVNAFTQQYSVYDNYLWSIMSYIEPTDAKAKYFGDYPVTGTSWGTDSDSGRDFVPTTPMIADILAIQRLYGAPQPGGALTDGGQTFGFNCNVAGPAGKYFDFDINTHPVVTIWDGGTGNKLDLSEFSADAVINLAPGTFTSCNGMVNNIGIALGTIIESVVGGSGNDRINGDAGGGILDGGAGDDAITSSSSLNQVLGGIGDDRLLLSSDYNNISGGDGNDQLQVVGAGNIVHGDGGNDSLIASHGANQLHGGAGDDTYFLDNASDAVFENPNEGIDTVHASVHFRLSDNVENLVLQGSADLQGYGNDLGNTLTSNDGRDFLAGGPGNDIYFVNNTGQVVFENPNEGNDTVFSTDHFRLAANVENLWLQDRPSGGGGDNLQGYGNELENQLYGNSGNNLLNGGVAADGMFGSLGDDVYFADNIADAAIEKPDEGNDTVLSLVDFRLADDVENLVLQGSADLQGYGNAESNALFGNGGNNLLDGGAGPDTLTGGGGNDVFLFRVGQASGDTITDFAGSSAAAGDALMFVGYGAGATFTNIDATQWQVNYNGGSAHEIITFMNGAAIVPSDFVFA